MPPRKTDQTPPDVTADNPAPPVVNPADSQATPAQAEPPMPDPIIATDDKGVERPLSGGSFERIDGKLVRRED